MDPSRHTFFLKIEKKKIHLQQNALFKSVSLSSATVLPRTVRCSNGRQGGTRFFKLEKPHMKGLGAAMVPSTIPRNANATSVQKCARL